MPLPTINIAFKEAASDAIKRSQKGTVALILKDAAASGALTLTSAAQIPKALAADNASYIARAFLGHTNAPRRVLAYVLGADAANLDDALAWLGTQTFDYLCAPPDVTAEQARAVKAWILEQRAEHRIYKAVLPHLAADTEAVVNLTTDGCKVGGVTLDAAAMCSRIAGLIAGTPMANSCTYAPLPELADIGRLTQAAGDAAVDNGEFILIHDGVKVKVGRAVNSLKTLPAGKSKVYKKIKIVELLDMIDNDIRVTAADTYIGRGNSYQNKLVLVTAITTYFQQLESEGLLQPGSTVDIDVEATREYLVQQGVDISELADQQIKEHSTDDKVFLTASIVPLDAIEDVSLNIMI
ncbi:phage tail sheath protein [Intestinibacillus massiliensis]|nr:phage tail sheath protein [Intestinibacillus massiliensis]